MISTGYEPTYTWSEMQKQIALAVKHDRQQRTWVGLTEEEQSAMWDRAEKRQAYQGVPALAALIQEVEAKLKEKNNA